MSKERFKCYYCNGIENIIVEDTINNETYIEDNIVNLLNQQDQRIAELEEQLKNAIVPKFKLYDTVYIINRDRADNIESGEITQISFDGSNIIYQFTTNQTNYCHTYTYKDEENVFATKEEAQAKLKELKGE